MRKVYHEGVNAEESGQGRIDVVSGDITRCKVEAIANAANERMLGGGGVDGAIHRAAGPELYEACKALPVVRRGVRCPTGEARLTPGYRLPAKWVIHTVGPVWHGGKRGEDEALASCYRNCLSLARENGIRSIAFPAISTGVYGFPLACATRIALAETKAFLAAHPLPERVVFVCFGPEALRCYRENL